MATSNDYKTLTPDTKKLLKGGEGRAVDYKEKASGVKPEDIVAFANARGGTILVGVVEKKDQNGKQYGQVVGCSIDDQARQGFNNCAANCRPAIDIEIRVENTGTNSPIFRIDVPEGNRKPYCTQGGLYKIRADGQNVAIDPEMMVAMILERESEQFLARFKAAADEVDTLIRQNAHFLSSKIEELDSTVYAATRAARDAETAARVAEQAARDAEKAAVDAGKWAAS